MMLTCERCETQFEKTNKRGPTPRFCSEACKKAKHRQRKEAPPAPVQQGLTLRDVINVAQLPLSVKQCDVVLEAFNKARLRAAKRERETVGS